MPATRIRGRAPFSVSTGGGSTGTGTNPAGSSLTTDDMGAIEVMLAEAAAATPVSAETFALNVAQPGESNSTPADSISDVFIIFNPSDTAATPTGGHSETVVVGSSSVTQTAGTGWTNPANAQGVNDGTNATITSAANISPTPASGTLTGTYSAVLPAGTTEVQQVGMTVTFYASLTVGFLGSGSLALQMSADGGSNYGTLQTITATSSGPYTFNQAITLSSISTTLRFRVVCTVTASATAASTATLDAVTATFNLIGASG